MTEIQARPNRLPWPPLVYLAAIAASIALHLLYPLPFIGRPLSDILFAAGALLIVAVVAIDLSAIRALQRAKTTVMPHRGAEHLVTDGPFSFTRNPIYLANTMLMFGAGLLSQITWFFPLALIAAFITQKLAIEREEKHLEVRFGKKYRDYAKRVRRWI
ncbi:Protein-S-isoprenylcysteine O-methyltransferase Ste14 [Mesorhizobium albiziae]|uniref:Protein-S-isoprenylcysteine O-methyltransferase Ste14 n=1 Tax=Neomesorhizobium albiziae TaxID=335020 RepID=A0A1I3YSH9_9HYPH|nr:isoprenylcysteine carboxylmethyltransferase family protein [Mesorhizobium albiziae]GLS33335.1 isoprenylcysteine carboxyl methyltransferase [Mesorhizobium albiziae]SFK34309.1 Protein-S-isoprenylcysteine O-methyltransferase Ste14 [Mesorhizobium albiziae]